MGNDRVERKTQAGRQDRENMRKYTPIYLLRGTSQENTCDAKVLPVRDAISPNEITET